jgi:ABC-2 type transport system ATP-binding protein
MGEMIIQTHALTKHFKHPFFVWQIRARALTNLNLNIERGEIFGLLGPNGSGKSTTIKLLLGMLWPTTGEIAVFNRRPRDLYVKRRLGYLPEETNLYRFLNAEETLDFYARLFQIPRRERRRRVEALLDLTGLRHARSRPLGEFSKGMQRRIGLAQALINDPELVILDEPTSGLDPLGIREIKNLILELKAKKKTVLLSSHLLDDVEDICDRVAILYGGKVRAEGTVESLLRDE